MLVKTILNKIEQYKSFIFDKTQWETVKGTKSIVITIRARANSTPCCSQCGRRGTVYDTQPARLYEYVPLWGFPVFFRYVPRRVSCPKDGVRVERVPWAAGKERMTTTYKIFLARWARRLSWKETAEVFRSSWDSVFRAVKYVVSYGLAHRDLQGVESIGVDEIQVFHGHDYLTLVYQLDEQSKRLLWSAPERKAKTLHGFFRQWGKKRSRFLKYVCSDLWAPYLKVIKKKAPQAVHILDRFHIMKKFNEAIDTIRREEVNAFKKKGQENVLVKSRWLLLKKPEHLSEKQTVRLGELLKINLSSIKAYMMREDFQRFWEFTDQACAAKFLQDWVTRTLQSNLEPMKKVAIMLRRHQPLIINWFSSQKRLSSGTVEGFNLKAKLTMRKAYGFKNPECLQVALYHTLGNLPEPCTIHRFSG